MGILLHQKYQHQVESEEMKLTFLRYCQHSSVLSLNLFTPGPKTDNPTAQLGQDPSKP